jgi:hypothetical protein
VSPSRLLLGWLFRNRYRYHLVLTGTSGVSGTGTSVPPLKGRRYRVPGPAVRGRMTGAGNGAACRAAWARKRASSFLAAAPGPQRRCAARAARKGAQSASPPRDRWDSRGRRTWFGDTTRALTSSGDLRASAAQADAPRSRSAGKHAASSSRSVPNRPRRNVLARPLAVHLSKSRPPQRPCRGGPRSPARASARRTVRRWSMTLRSPQREP